MITLNNKEKMLLEDEKSHEQLCIDKYTEYSSQASDPNLKSLFNQLAQNEQKHLDSINQILSGAVPNINQQQGQQQQQQQQQQQSNQTVQSSSEQNIDTTKDKKLCQDSLATEKFISSTYNTTVFECRDTGVRQVLNHIQKEEQEHGEQIYNYMNQHGMY